MHMYMYMCVDTYNYTYTHVYVYIYMYIYICIYTCNTHHKVYAQSFQLTKPTLDACDAASPQKHN